MDKLKQEFEEITNEIDYQEILKRSIKYIIFVLTIAVSLVYIPKNKLLIREIVIISLIGAIVFGILDMYSPSISCSIK